MFILKEGRSAFLEFLRNLTPQILLLSLTIVVGNKLNPNEFDLKNWPQTLIFFSFLVMTLLSAIANVTLFIDKFSPLTEVFYNKHFAGPRPIFQWQRFLRRTWEGKWVLIEFTFIIILVEFSIVAMFLHAIFAALKISD